ncbi:hypothetical protein Dimus_030763 [Dionaea muscipula]
MINKRAVGASLNDAGCMMLKMISIKGCYRFICSHPLLIVMLLSLTYMYRSFPSVFSHLVSASPIIICTAVLLGVLLTLGQKNNNQVTEMDRKMSNDFAPLKTRVVDHTTSITQSDWSRTKARFSEVRKEIIEKEIKEFQPGLSGYGVGKIMEKDRLVSDSIPVNVGSSRDIQLEGEPKPIEKADGGNTESAVKGGSIAVPKMDPLYSSSSEPEKPVDDDDQKSLDSESDVADKSSIDVSVVADTITTLNEVDPLLDTPQCTEQKGETDGGDGEEDNDEPEEANDDGDDEEEEEEEELSCKEDDGSKRVITWTEDDQKNLIDLNSSELERDQCLENLIARRSHRNGIEGREETTDGDDEEDTPRVEEEDSTQRVVTWTEDDEKNLKNLGSSELERDQCLENLIARRRAWRNFSMIPDFNLIDLDSVDRPFQVPPVSTTRVNPFDMPDESNNQSGIPPVPGSAPSISLPRRNPFDYPDVFPEVKPQVGENSEEELMEVTQKEKFDFIGQSLERGHGEMNQKDGYYHRRHQSFSWGPNLEEEILKEVFEINSKDSFFRRYQSFGIGASRQEKRDLNTLRPYFVPEHIAAGDEGTNLPSFQRLSTDASDDTTSSSALETECLSHVDMELINRETEELPQINPDHHHIELGSHSSGGANSVPIIDLDEGTEDLDLAESSRDGEGSHGAESYTSEGENLMISVEDINVKTQGNHLKNGNGSNSLLSSLSEASKGLKSVKEDGGSCYTEQERDTIVEDPKSSSNYVLLNVPDSGSPDSHGHKEPVYDTSPSGVDKNISFSTTSVHL